MKPGSGGPGNEVRKWNWVEGMASQNAQMTVHPKTELHRAMQGKAVAAASSLALRNIGSLWLSHACSYVWLQDLVCQGA